MFADYHVHTTYSLDSDYPMEEVIRDAIRLGINEICFTDHVDLGIYYNGKETMIDIDKYIGDIEKYRQMYPEITIKTGLELGMQSHTIERYQEIYDKYNFDFLIMSVHEIDNLELWTMDYQKGRTQDEYNLGYYNEILYLVNNYKNYSVLGHLDSIVRYDPLGPIDFEVIRPVVEEILRAVIKDGKGIEINTSCTRYKLKDMTPSRKILELYHELGGTVLTLGSDSHKKEHLGFNIENTKNILREIGFKYFMTFDGMEMTKHEL